MPVSQSSPPPSEPIATAVVEDSVSPTMEVSAELGAPKNGGCGRPRRSRRSAPLETIERRKRLKFTIQPSASLSSQSCAEPPSGPSHQPSETTVSRPSAQPIAASTALQTSEPAATNPTESDICRQLQARIAALEEDVARNKRMVELLRSTHQQRDLNTPRPAQGRKSIVLVRMKLRRSRHKNHLNRSICCHLLIASFWKIASTCWRTQKSSMSMKQEHFICSR